MRRAIYPGFEQRTALQRSTILRRVGDDLGMVKGGFVVSMTTLSEVRMSQSIASVELSARMATGAPRK